MDDFVSPELQCVFVLYIKATQLLKLQRIGDEIRQRLDLLSSIRKREVSAWGRGTSGDARPAKGVKFNVSVLTCTGEQTQKTNGDP